MLFRLGDHCLFAHGEDEVKELALPSASSSLPRLTRTPELQAGNSQMHVNGENNVMKLGTFMVIGFHKVFITYH